MKLLALLCMLSSCYLSTAQNVNTSNGVDTLLHKQLPAIRTTEKIVIDGDISDAAWSKAALADQFVEWRPSFGQPENPLNKTEIRILYNNEAIYISGFCHEQSNDSIAKELVGRDMIGVNDFVGIMFDTYNDKINGFGYYITPLGEQFDAKYSNSGEDPNWNSVYESAAKIVSGGWVFEMKIPYAAIRFSKKNVQEWGINITRKRSKIGKQYMWNPVNPAVNGFFTQFGLWTGIANIKPPVRLSFSPYFSLYGNSSPSVTNNQQLFSSSVSGGMDVKYGINQAMTLDMTLIPDFGQVQSDNRVLNLTPFEVKYNENRSFFTEGTELFGKGNLFYSRRIGGEPIHYGDVNNQTTSTEKILSNPSESKLINATKLSGRTAKGLGIGVFNAITKAQQAVIENESTKQKRLYETEPLTNYNIFVLDQTLKHNSSVSFINTNVLRNGTDYDANVSAALWDLYDKKNNYNFGGKVATSMLRGVNGDGKHENGYSHSIYFGKSSGRFNFNVYQDLVDHRYNQNDMGYLTNNNFFDHGIWAAYRWLKPSKWYNRFTINGNMWYSMRYFPRSYQNFGININTNGQLKNLWFVGGSVNYNASEQDFYEPRIQGYVFKRPQNVNGGIWIETNSANKYSASAQYYVTAMPQWGSLAHNIGFTNQYRFNTKFTLSTNSTLDFRHNNVGFATIYNTNDVIDSIVFAKRHRTTIENIVNLKYNFTNKMGLNCRVRHYWSVVNNQSYFKLQSSGKLENIADINRDVNQNLNLFNVDFVYTWQFALGSFVNVVWKNAIFGFDSNINNTYFNNLGNVLAQPQSNSVSIRVIYFLDYLNLHKKS